MARFRYAALDVSGRAVSGELTAEEPGEVPRRLRDMGLFPTEVRELEPEQVSPAAPRLRRRRISGTDVTVITRQLADMIAAGLSSYRSLGVLVEQAESPALREMLSAIRQEVQEGAPLSAALGSHRRLFSNLYVNMVRAGEASGHLDAVLQRLADFLEKASRRRSQVISALTYPAVLTVVAFAAVGFITTFLLPRLGAVFADFQASLPAVTRALLAGSRFLSKTWWLLLIVVGLLGLGFRVYARSSGGQRALGQLLLRLPALGGILRKMVISRFARTLGTMLVGGVPILQALEITGDAVGSAPYAEAVERTREQVQGGAPLAEALANVGIFLPVVVQMAAVGEETGTLPEMMLKVADGLDFEVDAGLTRFTSLLEPAMILVMGVVVGGMVLAVLLPIFQLSATIAR